jgi:methionyl-tRNA synthetase
MSKNYYVTTSIPYVNGEPHVGHAMEFVMTDVMARYHRQQGDAVIYGTGTDEHGTKIAETAAKLGKEPKQLVDEMTAKFTELHSLLNSKPDSFIRTTSKEHISSAQAVWKALKGSVYKGEYSGWYCVGCEEFKTQAEVTELGGDCPIHKRPYEELKEENYFFKLSEYSDRIEQAVASGEFQIIPEHRKNEILNVIRSGLNDISISRPKAKLAWGVPVPGDTKQVMYVWVEALMNYITQLGYPDGKNFKEFWPADLQIIGKDIIRFHAAIWPGMLLALGLPLPKKLYVHGFITMNGEKMSKSLGNVVSPIEMIEKYGVDATRYYFLRHIPSYDDGDFTWERFDAVYHGELANELGNAVQRVASMINRYQQGVIGEITKLAHDTGPYHEALESQQFDRALEWVWGLVKGLNVYIEETKPWQIAKNHDAEHLKEVLAACVADVLQIAHLLEPFMPQTSETIQHIFKDGYVHNYSGVLFPRIEESADGSK